MRRGGTARLEENDRTAPRRLERRVVEPSPFARSLLALELLLLYTKTKLIKSIYSRFFSLLTVRSKRRLDFANSLRGVDRREEDGLEGTGEFFLRFLVVRK